MRAELLEPLFHYSVGQFRPIAFLAQVSKIQMAQVSRDDLLGGIGGRLVREVAVPAQDPLLETPGTVGALLQHLHIVVGLQYQSISAADPFEHQPGGMTEIGEKSNIAPSRAHEKADGILCVVGHSEALDQQIADLETRPGLKAAAAKLDLKHVFDGFLGQAVAIDWDAKLFAQDCQPLGVVGVFVRNEDAGEAFRRSANGCQAFPNLTNAQPGVDQKARFVRFEIGAVAGGATAENSKANSHGRD